MTPGALCSGALTVLLLVQPAGSAVIRTSPTRQPSAAEALRSALAFWTTLPDGMEVSDLDPEVTTAIREFAARTKRFQSHLRPPADKAPELQEAFLRKQMLERTAYALGTGSNAGSEAASLAAHVSPAYEWEGFSGGPLGEMEGADRYVARYPHASIRPYALLLVGHRGICALEALRYELVTDHGDRSSNLRRQVTIERQYKRALDEAALSPHPLVRFVAADLRRTPRCL